MVRLYSWFMIYRACDARNSCSQLWRQVEARNVFAGRSDGAGGPRRGGFCRAETQQKTAAQACDCEPHVGSVAIDIHHLRRGNVATDGKIGEGHDLCRWPAPAYWALASVDDLQRWYAADGRRCCRAGNLQHRHIVDGREARTMNAAFSLMEKTAMRNGRLLVVLLCAQLPATGASGQSIAPGETMVRGSAPVTFKVAVKVSNLMPDVAQVRVNCVLLQGGVPIIHGETTSQISSSGNFDGV